MFTDFSMRSVFRDTFEPMSVGPWNLREASRRSGISTDEIQKRIDFCNRRGLARPVIGVFRKAKMC